MEAFSSWLPSTISTGSSGLCQFIKSPPICSNRPRVPLTFLLREPLANPCSIVACSYDTFNHDSEAFNLDLKEGNLQNAVSRIEHIVEVQRHPSEPIVSYQYFHQLITCCARQRQFYFSVRALGALERTGYVPGRQTTSVLINALCLAGQVHEAYRIIQDLWSTSRTLSDGSNSRLSEQQIAHSRPNEKMVSQVADAAIKNGSPQMAVSVFNTMQQNGVIHTKFSYSILIKAYGRLNKSDAILKLLDKFEKYPSSIDVVVINAAIDALVRCGQIHKAEDLLDNMDCFHLRPLARSYNPVLRELARRGDVKKTLKLREKMQAIGIRPSMYTYNSVILAYVESEQFENAVRELSHGMSIFAANQTSYMSKDVCVGFSTIISGLARRGHTKQAVKILEELVERTAQANMQSVLQHQLGIAITSVVSALINNNEIMEGWALFRTMHKRFNVRASIVTYNAVVRGLSRRGEEKCFEAADHAFKEMLKIFWSGSTRYTSENSPADEVVNSNNESMNMRTIVMAYNSMMDGYIRVGNIQKAEMLLGDMESGGLRPTVVSYTILMDGYGRQHDVSSAERTFLGMQRKGILPDVTAINTLIGACIRNDEMETAEKLFNKMGQSMGSKSLEQAPDIVTFSAMIAGYVRRDDTVQAWNMYERMKGTGINPNERLLDRMMAAFVDPMLRPSRDEVWGVDDVENMGDMYGSVLTHGKENGNSRDKNHDDNDVAVSFVSTERSNQSILPFNNSAAVVEPRSGTWDSACVRVLLHDMERCRCSEMTRRRWRTALRSLSE